MKSCNRLAAATRRKPLVNLNSLDDDFADEEIMLVPGIALYDFGRNEYYTHF